MSRWFVGSSRSSRSGCAASARARQLAAGERCQRPVEIVIRETEAADHPRRALTPVVAACVLEPRLRGSVPRECFRIVFAACHRRLELPQFRLDGDKIGGPRQNVLAKRSIARRGRTLIVQGDAGALLPGELTALQPDLACDRPEQSCLSGSVRPGQGEPVAALELEGDAVEQGGSGDLLTEVGCN
jgi:hypothetical protein